MPGKPRGPGFGQQKPPPKTRPDRLRMPWEAPTGAIALEDADVFALQALEKGIANAGQQQRALAVFRDKLCEVDRMSFYPGEDGRRASDFAEGKRHVGLQLNRFLKMRPAKTEAGEKS